MARLKTPDYVRPPDDARQMISNDDMIPAAAAAAADTARPHGRGHGEKLSA